MNDEIKMHDSVEIPIEEIKDWIDKKIKEGKKSVYVEIEYGRGWEVEYLKLKSDQ